VKGWFLVALLSWTVLSLGADTPTPLISEAVDLELEGRLGESLDRYRAALSSEPALVQDEGLTKAATIQAFSKAAHLSIDLGYAEEAWDLSARLLAAKNQAAVEAGTLVRLRFFRIQKRWAEALALFDSYASAWPLPPPGPAMLFEVQRIRRGAKGSTTVVESLIQKAPGPAAWVLAGDAWVLPGPTEVWDLAAQETVRLQVGAFADWSNALTLIDMLREKGWSPFTDVKDGPRGEKLHVVYVVSRQPGPDRSRLEAQGLTALPER